MRYTFLRYVTLPCCAMALMVHAEQASPRHIVDTTGLDARALALRAMIYTAPDSALLLATAMEHEMDGPGLEKWKASALNTQGVVHFTRSEFPAALDAFTASRALRERIGDHIGAARSLMNIGNVYKGCGRVPTAIDHYQRALKIFNDLHDRRSAAGVLYNIGGLCLELGDTLRSVEYMRQGLASDPEPQFRMALTLGLGINLGARGDLDGAISVLLAGLDSASHEGMESFRCQIEVQLGYAYRAAGRWAEAETHLRRGIELGQRLSLQGELAKAWSQLAAVRLDQDLKPQALPLLLRAQAFFDAQSASVDKLGNLQALYEVSKAMGHATEALRYNDLYLATRDSLNARATQEALDRLEFSKQLTADSLKKEQELASLQRAHQQELSSEQGRKRLFLFGGISVALVAGGLWWRLRKTHREKKRSEEILYNVLPEEVAKEIRNTGGAQSREIEQVSILFTDFKGFTELSARISRQELMDELNACFHAFDGIIGRHGVEKIKTIGDSYMAASGLKGNATEAAVGMVYCALEMQAFIHARKSEHDAQGLPAFQMRAGIHTGPVVAGIVGVKKFQYDIWGDTVNTASRMESSGEVGRVNISEATYALVKNEPGLHFTPRGKVQAKGKGEMEMYFVQQG